jgi:2-C-methyl-D-erythritol 2,4-cyclodiphosphate synthase
LHRVGFGEDAHRLAEGRRLVLAGLEVSGSPHGAIAHSDGDALLHAVADALLSALALGDIGQFFPDTDPANAALDSTAILHDALRRVSGAGYRVVNVAAVVTLDRPKLGPLRVRMQENLAGLLGLPAGSVGLGFKTSEWLAPSHVQARATVLLERISS